MNINEVISKIRSKEFPMSELIQMKNNYIPFMTKREIVNSVIGLSTYIDDESDMMRVDRFFSELFTAIFVTLEMSDLEIDDLYEDDGSINIENAVIAYDSMIQHGIYSYISQVLDTYTIEMLISDAIEEKVSVHNSIASVLKRMIDFIVEKIPTEDGIKSLIQSIPEQLSGLKNLNILNLEPEKKSRKIKKE